MCRFLNLVGVSPTPPQPLLCSFAPAMLLPQGFLRMSSATVSLCRPDGPVASGPVSCLSAPGSRVGHI